MAEQDKPIWCRLITIEQWSVYMDLIADCSPSKVAYLSCEDSEQRLANRSREAADLYLLTQSKTGCDCDDSIEGRFQRWYQEQIEEEAVQKQISLSAFKHQLPVSTKTRFGRYRAYCSCHVKILDPRDICFRTVLHADNRNRNKRSDLQSALLHKTAGQFRFHDLSGMLFRPAVQASRARPLTVN